MKASNSMRVWFGFFGALIWVGMYLTGFSNIHWLLYVPAAGMVFAAVTGICPSQIAVFKILGSK
ncbi:MAG: hypothetical protein A2V93_05560 [Ignavibacteria bacterium RBG_16_34_14]|nr:MAG: hypothetical protein A2V93_05560 [Ignavibacteria bacterium RBG_16_34_14]